jgi:hypothetical protein
MKIAIFCSVIMSHLLDVMDVASIPILTSVPVSY